MGRGQNATTFQKSEIDSSCCVAAPVSDFLKVKKTEKKEHGDAVVLENIAVPQPLKKSLTLYDFGCSLACSKQPATCPYPEPH
jgi:hypothetical protein